MIHGRYATYKHGPCRCDPCRAANTRYTKHLRLDMIAGRPRTLDRTGTRRRLLALGVMGHSQRFLAANLGVSHHAVQVFIHGTGPVNQDTARRIRDLYDRLSMIPGKGDGRVAATARRLGGYPPLAWDDDTIDDPNAQPDLGARERGQDVDDIEWLIDCGGTWETIPQRMGVTKDGIDHALRRADRHDLIERLTRTWVAS